MITNPRIKSEGFLLTGTFGDIAVHPDTGEQIPKTIEVPCYHCLICEDNRRDEWATRLELESRTSKSSFFITLTYDDRNLPPDGDLSLKHLQDFFAVLRRKAGTTVRYFACGEYGPKLSHRPHYHSCVFLQSDLDKESFEALVRASWPKGFVSVSTPNRQRFRYVAKYTLKYLNASSGHSVAPFAVMSRRPGIGASFFQNSQGFYFSSIPLENGYKASIPRYGISKLDPVEQLLIKSERSRFVNSEPRNYTDEILRAHAREEQIVNKINQLYGTQEREFTRYSLVKKARERKKST